MAVIALTGGIGCGKSVVARVLGAIGYDVYDCDSRAKAIMDESAEIKARIGAEVCREAIGGDGAIDRAVLAAEVFGNRAKLAVLDSIVHNAVRVDLSRWSGNREVAFVETAILYQSGLDRMVDAVWNVDAPRDLRIQRVMTRSGLTYTQVESRMASQDEFVDFTPHPNIYSIVNDGVEPVLPQVERLLSHMRL